MKDNFYAFVATCVLASANTVSHAGLVEGRDAYANKNYAVALKEFAPLARSGDAEAQLHLGDMYQSGQGTTQDSREALKWYKLSADQGNAIAQYNVGWAYGNGLGVARDDTEGLNWIRLSADRGYAKAQYLLGAESANGAGPREYREAAKWMRMAADQGDTESIAFLGAYYYGGLGEAPNKVVGYALFLLAKLSPGNPNLSTKELEIAKALAIEMEKPGNLLKALDQYINDSHP